MNIDKTIRSSTNPEQGEAEIQRYRQSLAIGKRLSAVWELSAAAYGIKADQIVLMDKKITRVQRVTGGDNA